MVKSLLLVLTSVLVVTACAAARRAVTAEEVGRQLSGEWSGHFTNTQGTSFPVTFTITAESRRVTGVGNIPSSQVDQRPKVSGTYESDKVLWNLSSGFTYQMRMERDESGTYYLSGPVTGRNAGTMSLTKK